MCLSSRTMDGESEVEEKMSSLTGERGERTPPDYQVERERDAERERERERMAGGHQ